MESNQRYYRRRAIAYADKLSADRKWSESQIQDLLNRIGREPIIEQLDRDKKAIAEQMKTLTEIDESKLSTDQKCDVSRRLNSLTILGNKKAKEGFEYIDKRLGQEANQHAATQAH